MARQSDVGGQEPGDGLALEGRGDPELCPDGKPEHVSQVGVVRTFAVVKFKKGFQGFGTRVLLQVGRCCAPGVGGPGLEVRHRIGAGL